MKRGQDAPLQIPDARPGVSFEVEVRPSPNFGDRRDGKSVDMLVLHYTGMADGEGALSWLCDPRSEVSAHYLVFEGGRIVQMVAEAQRAWHAGRSHWAGESDINSCSIGIEIVNAGYLGCDEARDLPEFPGVQMAAVEALCLDILARHPIPRNRVLGHSDVAPGRKQDPGEKFDWQRLAHAGAGIWSNARIGESSGDNSLKIGENNPKVDSFHGNLRLFGYSPPNSNVFTSQTETIVRAFQQHWRPRRVDGIADAQTLARLDDLIRQSANIST